MRTITNESVNAFINGRSFKKANMSVQIDGAGVHLFLHNNLIASKINNKLRVTDAGWQTTTTKERLNGVLDAFNLPRLSQKKGVWYIGAEEFNGCKNFNI
jgi:hypothetical protein